LLLLRARHPPGAPERRLALSGLQEEALGPDDATSVFDMTQVVDGGTGRFAGQTGSGTTHGSSFLSTGIARAPYRGEIAY
jgi:hypothetical protein